MNKKMEIFLVISILLILIPIIFFPNSQYMSNLLQGTKAIIDGREFYTNSIIDYSPLVYYLFVPFYLIFGENELIIHLNNFIFQLLIVFSLIFLLKKITFSKKIAYTCSLVYALLYSGNSLNAFEIDFIFIISLIWICYLYFFSTKLSVFIIIGLGLGFITSLKFSYVLTILPFLILILVDKTSKLKLKLFKCSIILLFSAFSFAIIYLLIVSPQINKEFFTVSNLYHISNSTNLFNIEYFKNVIKEFSFSLGWNITLAVVLSSAIGFYYIIIKSNDKNNIFFSFMALLAIFNLFSNIQEQNLNKFDLNSMIFLFSIFSSFGIYKLFLKLKSDFKYYNTSSKFVIIILLIIGLVFSPLPRWLSVIPAPYLYFYDKDMYKELFINIEISRNDEIC